MPATSFESLEPRRLFNSDPSFGTSGVATIDLGEGVAMRPTDVTVASDGSVIAVGAASVLLGLPTDLAPAIGIVRLNPDGSPDERFAPNGFVFDTPGGMDAARSVAVTDGSASFFVAGVRDAEGLVPPRVVLAKYTRTGKHDRTFDARGRGSVIVPQLRSIADIEVLTNGSMLLAGTTQNGDAAVVRLTPAGRTDTTFGENGLTPTISQFDGITRSAGAIAVDLNGRIILGLTVSDPAAGDDVVVRRFTASGARDASFGTSGILNVPEITGAQQLPDETLRGLAVDPTHRTYVYYGREGGDEMRVARFLENGQLDAGFFGTGGVALMPDHFTAGTFDASPARMATVAGVTLVEGARTSARFVGGATDRNGPLVPGVVGVGADGSTGGFGVSGVAEMTGVEDAHAILAASPGAMIISLAVPADPEGTRELSLAPFLSDLRPSAVLNIKPVERDGVSIGGDPAQFWVTYRCPTGIDLDSIDSGDLHVTMPDGSVRTAHVGKVEPNDDNTAVTVRYKIPAPGGQWDAADNGDYVIRLRSREAGVRTPANDIFAIGQVLGTMTVDL